LAVRDDFFVFCCAKLVKAGKTLLINDTVYLRTMAGMAAQ